MATRLLAKEHTAFDPLMSAEAASYLNMHEETLKLHARHRRIACVKDRGAKARVKFRLSALNKWIMAREKPASRTAIA